MTFLARAHMVDAAQDCCWSTFAHVLHLKSQGVVPLKFLSPCFCVWDIAFGPRIPFLCTFFQTVCFLWVCFAFLQHFFASLHLSASGFLQSKIASSRPRDEYMSQSDGFWNPH